ncbi:MAG TPA: hypothetical protein PK708_07720 [Candidatus Competibacter sp.]|nr:hypothetical protein [Candidatus Competibacter sp.]
MLLVTRVTRVTRVTTRYQYIEFVDARNGYSLTGQIVKGAKWYEFNCLVSTRMSITDLVINPLSGGEDNGGGS